ncbi:MAG: uroporphyrinogen decarboxylase family protein [Candidatus Heimdallarchaeota archaeon]
MDAVERVLKAINHEEPDRVPAFESAFTNNTIVRHYGINPTSGRGYKIAYEFFQRAKIDLVLSYVSPLPRIWFKRGKGFIDEYGRIIKFDIQKDGTLILAYYGGYLKSFEDYESWERIELNSEKRLKSFLDGRSVQEEMNNEIFSIPSIASLLENPLEGFGLTTFSKILAKPAQAKKIFDDYGKITVELVKILAENDAKIVLLWDDYGYKNGLFMKPINYQKYIFPWLKRICETAHKNDCKIMLHSDGDILEIFDDIVKCGVNIINPIEPTTNNPKYDIFELNKKYGDKITFSGNVNPVWLAIGEIPEIEAYARKLIRELAPGGGYLFGSGHSIHPAVTIDRFEAMQNVRRKYGNYPIGNIPN